MGKHAKRRGIRQTNGTPQSEIWGNKKGSQGVFAGDGFFVESFRILGPYNLFPSVFGIKLI